MLLLQLHSGEYLTIGENIAVQVFRGPGDRIRVGINAPKDVAILRGEVRERNGAPRPEGLVGPFWEGSDAQAQKEPPAVSLG